MKTSCTALALSLVILSISDLMADEPESAMATKQHFFERLDANKDGKVTFSEAPEDGKMLVEFLLSRAGKKKVDSLSQREFMRLTSTPNLRSDAGRQESTEGGDVDEENRSQIAAVNRTITSGYGRLPKPTIHMRFYGGAKLIESSSGWSAWGAKKFEENAMVVDEDCDYETRPGSLDLNEFTVATKFKIRRKPTRRGANLFWGGRNDRWFGLGVGESGKLMVMLNNAHFETSFDIKPNEWYTVVCGVDIKGCTIQMHVNGEILAGVRLPEDFVHSVARRRSNEKTWNFGSRNIDGLIKDFVAFNGLLAPEAASSIRFPLAPFKEAARPVITDRRLEGLASDAVNVTWSADGRQVGAASKRGKVRVWNAQTGEQTAEMQLVPENLKDRLIAFSLDLRKVATNRGGRVSIRRIPDNVELASFDTILDAAQPSAFRPTLHALAFSPDGNRLAAAASSAAVVGRHGLPGGNVTVWDLATGALVHKSEILSTAAVSVMWSGNGERFAAGTSGAGGELQEAGKVHVWDARTGKELAGFSVQPQTKYGEWVSADTIALDQNGHGVAFAATGGTGSAPAGLIVERGGAIVQLRKLSTGKTETLLSSPEAVERLQFNRDGSKLGLSLGDSMMVWDREVGKRVADLKHAGRVTAFDFHPHELCLVIARKDGVIRIRRYAEPWQPPADPG